MADRLRAVQARFLAGVIGGDVDAEALIVDDNRVGAAKRLDIYRNNYRSSLKEVLADHFERLHAYLGDEQFDNIVEAYVSAHPSAVRNLRFYGAEFPAFLARHYPDDGELAELADLDWAMRHAFDAADAKPLDAVQVGALGDAWVERRLTLHPSARLLTSDHNVAALWSALDSDEEPPEPERLVQPARLLVWRHDLRSNFRSLPDVEAEALALLATGCSFAGLSGHAIERLGEAAAVEMLAAWLARWLADGVLVVADQRGADDQGAEVT